MKAKRGGGRPGAYRTKAGLVVPGTTTITGRFRDSGALIRWAFNCGRDGIDMNARKDDAASSGTIAHEMIESAIHGVENPSPPSPFELGMRDDESYRDIVKKATACFEAFKTWRAQTNVEIVVTELPLVSEEHLFGGTIDAIFRINGKLFLGDWKSSGRVYADMLSQMGAYLQVWEEHNPDQPLEGVHILRFGKEDASFHHHAWQRHTLETGRDAFLLMRKLYDMDKVLQKAVG